MAGDSANNITIRAHRMRGTGVSDYKLHHHLGATVNAESNMSASQRQFYRFRQACVSGDDAKMDAAGTAAWGTFYTDHVVTPSAAQKAADPNAETNRDTLRALVQALGNSE